MIAAMLQWDAGERELSPPERPRMFVLKTRPRRPSPAPSRGTAAPAVEEADFRARWWPGEAFDVD
jgi:hypothetical protein